MYVFISRQSVLHCQKSKNTQDIHIKSSDIEPQPAQEHPKFMQTLAIYHAVVAGQDVFIPGDKRVLNVAVTGERGMWLLTANIQ